MPESEGDPTATQMLRSEGKRVTPQRQLLLGIIRRSEGHLDADELYRQARQEDPRISLSTVYRTLNLLKELDMVEEVHFDEDHHHYELAAETHHHLVCAQCGRIVEFQSPTVAALTAELEQKHGFALDRLQIEGLGRCQRCQKTSAQ